MGKTIDNIAKGICLILVIFASILLIGVLFGGDDSASNSHPATTPIPPTEPKLFTPYGRYAENYIPSITEIGDGTDWYMTKKETKLEGLVCTAVYTKDEHRTVVILISVCPTVDGAKGIYDKRVEDAPYVECPTMGVCDQSFQYVEEIPDQYGMHEEVGTGVIRDGNIIVLFTVHEENMFIGLNSYDMERYAKNIEKKINEGT